MHVFLPIFEYMKADAKNLFVIPSVHIMENNAEKR